MQLDSSSSLAGFTCQPSSPPSKANLLRLTAAQYQNTVFSLMQMGLSGADLTNFNSYWGSAAVVAILGSFPTEGNYDKGDALIYDTEDQRITERMTRAEGELAIALGQWLAADTGRLARFVNQYAGTGACSSSVPNVGAQVGCYTAFIKNFGLRALRRPVVTTSVAADLNDLAFYSQIYTDATEGGFDSVISSMMLSPDAVFLSQTKGTAAGTIVTLTNYEVAAKMAYYYTDFPPDEVLFSAAASGFLGPGNSLGEQADRLFKSPKARLRFTNFYSQWIRPSAIPNLSVSSNSPATDLVQLRANAIQEMVDLTEYYTFGLPSGKVSDLVSSNLSFAKTADLAGVYGTPVWSGKNSDGSYDPNKLVSFAPSNPHPGLFTRAGYSFSGARDNNLIIRGARIRKDYFCQNLNPPAAFNLSDDLPLRGPPTIENIVVANTEIPGSSCIGCHQQFINPMGIELENYDAFGRFRTQEPFFNKDGTMNGSVTVNTSATPLAANGDPEEIHDVATFTQKLGESDAFNACFVRHYFRFAAARAESSTADGCQLTKMLTTLKDPNDGSIRSMVKAFVTDSSFKIRNISP